jgi:hypothetical protein
MIELTEEREEARSEETLLLIRHADCVMNISV